MAISPLRTCPSCNTRVLPGADDSCPSCGKYRFSGAPEEMHAPAPRPASALQRGLRLPVPAAVLRFYLIFVQPINVARIAFVVVMFAQDGGSFGDYFAVLLIRAARMLFGW